MMRWRKKSQSAHRVRVVHVASRLAILIWPMHRSPSWDLTMMWRRKFLLKKPLQQNNSKDGLAVLFYGQKLVAIMCRADVKLGAEMMTHGFRRVEARLLRNFIHGEMVFFQQ